MVVCVYGIIVVSICFALFSLMLILFQLCHKAITYLCSKKNQVVPTALDMTANKAENSPEHRLDESSANLAAGLESLELQGREKPGLLSNKSSPEHGQRESSQPPIQKTPYSDQIPEDNSINIIRKKKTPQGHSDQIYQDPVPKVFLSKTPSNTGPKTSNLCSPSAYGKWCPESRSTQRNKIYIGTRTCTERGHEDNPNHQRATAR